MNQIVSVALVAFLLGFIVGWLVEWWIDVAYRQTRALQRALDEKRGQRTGEPLLVFKNLLKEKEEEIQNLRAELEAGEARLSSLRAALDKHVEHHSDDLTAIKGIGRVYQQKLHDAGINSYSQLAQMTPERIREIIDAPAWRKLEPEKWIEQAAILAKRGE